MGGSIRNAILVCVLAVFVSILVSPAGAGPSGTTAGVDETPTVTEVADTETPIPEPDTPTEGSTEPSTEAQSSTETPAEADTSTTTEAEGNTGTESSADTPTEPGTSTPVEAETASPTPTPTATESSSPTETRTPSATESTTDTPTATQTPTQTDAPLEESNSTTELGNESKTATPDAVETTPPTERSDDDVQEDGTDTTTDPVENTTDDVNETGNRTTTSDPGTTDESTTTATEPVDETNETDAPTGQENDTSTTVTPTAAPSTDDTTNATDRPTNATYSNVGETNETVSRPTSASDSLPDSGKETTRERIDGTSETTGEQTAAVTETTQIDTDRAVNQTRSTVEDADEGTSVLSGTDTRSAALVRTSRDTSPSTDELGDPVTMTLDGESSVGPSTDGTNTVSSPGFTTVRSVIATVSDEATDEGHFGVGTDEPSAPDYDTPLSGNRGTTSEVTPKVGERPAVQTDELQWQSEVGRDDAALPDVARRQVDGPRHDGSRYDATVLTDRSGSRALAAHSDANSGVGHQPGHDQEHRDTADMAVSDLDGAEGSGIPLPDAPQSIVALVILIAGAVAVRSGNALAGTLSTAPGALAVQTRTFLDALRAWLGRLPRVLPIPGYSRHDDSDPLENEHRARLHEVITDSPGVDLAALVETTGMSRSTARYHLRVLEHEDIVVREEILGQPRLFPDGTDDVAFQVAARDDATRAVLAAISRHEPATGSTLAEQLDLDASTVSHHLKRLADAGLVEREREGRAVVNRLSPAARGTVPLSRRSLEPSETTSPSDD